MKHAQPKAEKTKEPLRPAGKEPSAVPAQTVAAEKPASPAPETETPLPQMVEPPPQVAISRAELDDLRAQAKKAAENWDRYLRVAADFDNYKKRAAREKEEAARYTREKLLRRLLPIIDALERGLESVAQTQDRGTAEGMKIIQSMLMGLLAECGVEEIPTVGVKFDPHLHQAIARQPSDQYPEDAVIQPVRRGFRIGDQVLRAADVVVSSGSPSAPSNTSEEQSS
jgi:molecular chaperone GrpE